MVTLAERTIVARINFFVLGLTLSSLSSLAITDEFDLRWPEWQPLGKDNGNNLYNWSLAIPAGGVILTGYGWQ